MTNQAHRFVENDTLALTPSRFGVSITYRSQPECLQDESAAGVPATLKLKRLVVIFPTGNRLNRTLLVFSNRSVSLIARFASDGQERSAHAAH